MPETSEDARVLELLPDSPNVIKRFRMIIMLAHPLIELNVLPHPIISVPPRLFLHLGRLTLSQNSKGKKLELPLTVTVEGGKTRKNRNNQFPTIKTIMNFILMRQLDDQIPKFDFHEFTNQRH